VTEPAEVLYRVPVNLPGRYFGAELAVVAVSPEAAADQANLLVGTLAGYTGQTFRLAVGQPYIGSPT